jgi:hypothetical protein
MRTLPFVVQPKKAFEKVQVGNEEWGILEIEKRGYLTVSEKAFVDGVTQGTDAVSSIVALATRISAKTNETTESVYQAIMAALQTEVSTPLAKKIKKEYSDELSTLISKMQDSAQKRAIAAATILIQSRLDPEWTVDDTLSQRPELIDDLSSFYTSEEIGEPYIQGSKESESEEAEADQESETVAEIVGKSTEGNGGK